MRGRSGAAREHERKTIPKMAVLGRDIARLATPQGSDYGSDLLIVKCSVDGCGKPHHAKQLCKTHYMRKSRGDVRGRQRRGDRDNPDHGTVNGYVNHGCHCDRCREAWAHYMAARQQPSRVIVKNLPIPRYAVLCSECDEHYTRSAVGICKKTLACRRAYGAVSRAVAKSYDAARASSCSCRSALADCLACCCLPGRLDFLQRIASVSNLIGSAADRIFGLAPFKEIGRLMQTDKCSVDGCNKARKYRFLCQMHYRRQHKHGDVNTVLPKFGVGLKPGDRSAPCPNGYGTENGYTNYGCRCPACREAKRVCAVARRAHTRHDSRCSCNGSD